MWKLYLGFGDLGGRGIITVLQHTLKLSVTHPSHSVLLFLRQGSSFLPTHALGAWTLLAFKCVEPLITKYFTNAG